MMCFLPIFRPCLCPFTVLLVDHFFYSYLHAGCCSLEASQVTFMVKNPPASAGDIRKESLIPGLGRSPGGRHGNPLQSSCLENHMDRGAWLATVHGVTESDTTEAIEHGKAHAVLSVQNHFAHTFS